MPPSSSSYLFAFFISTSTPVTHGRLSSYTPSDPLGWVSRAILSGPSSALGYEIHPSLIELVQENSFSRLKLWASLSSSTRGAKHFEQLRTYVSRIELSSRVFLKFCWKEPLLNSQNLGEWALHANPTTPRFVYGAFFLIFLETMSQGKLRKEWLEENGSFFMTRLSQPQLPGRGTIWSPSYSRVKATSEVFHRGICLDLDHHVISP